jgi:hypothetical protein
MMKLSYLTSVTHETDPNIRAQRLRTYREEVIAEFAQNPISRVAPQTAKTASENGPPDVIYMPPMHPSSDFPSG